MAGDILHLFEYQCQITVHTTLAVAGQVGNREWGADWGGPGGSNYLGQKLLTILTAGAIQSDVIVNQYFNCNQ